MLDIMSNIPFNHLAMMTKRLSREQMRAQTRQKLLDSARQLFVHNGVGSTSIDQIAESAGYSKGAFYSNFSDKDELFIALLRSHMESEVIALEEIFNQTETSEEVLGAIQAMYQKMEDDASICVLAVEFQLLSGRSQKFALAYAALFDRQIKAIAKLVEVLAERAHVSPPFTGEEAAVLLTGLANGILLQKYASQSNKKGNLAKALLLFLSMYLKNPD